MIYALNIYALNIYALNISLFDVHFCIFVKLMFLQLLQIITTAMDCELHAIQTPISLKNDKSCKKCLKSTGSQTLAYIREGLIRYCTNLGVVSWFGAVFNTVDGSTTSQVCTISRYDVLIY